MVKKIVEEEVATTAGATDALVTYLIKTNEGEFKISIPASYKVTYGPVSPGIKGYGGGDLALRIWENDNKQRAIFTGVKWFRDLAIPVMRKSTSKSGQITWSSSDTETSETRNTKKEDTWVEDKD